MDRMSPYRQNVIRRIPSSELILRSPFDILRVIKENASLP